MLNNDTAVDVEEQYVWLSNTAPLLLHEEKELEDEAININFAT